MYRCLASADDLICLGDVDLRCRDSVLLWKFAMKLMTFRVVTGSFSTNVDSFCNMVREYLTKELRIELRDSPHNPQSPVRIYFDFSRR